MRRPGYWHRLAGSLGPAAGNRCCRQKPRRLRFEPLERRRLLQVNITENWTEDAARPAIVTFNASGHDTAPAKPQGVTYTYARHAAWLGDCPNASLFGTQDNKKTPAIQALESVLAEYGRQQD